MSQCRVEVSVRGLTSSTFYCTEEQGHAGAHTIDVLGSDEFHEGLAAYRLKVREALAALCGAHA